MTDLRMNRMVGEQNVLEVRTSDPSTTEEGEMWLRSDLAPDTDQLATLRFDDGASILDIPIYATGSSNSSVSEALRVETPSGTGFIPTLPVGDATFQQLRFQHDGGVTAFHDEPAVASAFFDVLNLSTNSPVTEGEDLTATYDLENTVSEDGTQTIELLDIGGGVVDSASESVTAGTLETDKQLIWATSSGDAGSGDITVQSNDDAATAPVDIQASGAIPDSAVARWTFDNADTDSGTAIDVWGSYDGTITGATTGVSGKYNEAYSFDGNDDEVATTLNLETYGFTDITVAVWVKKSNFGQENKEGLFDVLDANGDRLLMGTAFGGSPNDYTNFDWTTSSGDITQTDITGDLTDGAWNLIVGVYDNAATNEMKLYTNDATLQAEASATLSSINSEPLLARDTDGQTLDGDMDDPRVYDKPLSSTEISNLYNTGSI